MSDIGQERKYSPAAESALSIYHEAVAAVRADRLIGQSVLLEGSTLVLPGHRIDLPEAGKILVVGAGKASAAMAAALDEVLGDWIASGLVVTKDGHAAATRVIEVIEAAHPVPDERSVEAGRRIVQLASTAEENDLVLCLLSGGASSLMELPEEGIDLEDLQAVTSLLLRAGAPIEELNAVRACLSKVKAGGLARTAGKARVLCLVLSDVLGNSLEVIGSGPCVATSRDQLRALRVLETRGLMEVAPAAVIQHLRGATAGHESAARRADHVILGDIRTALSAARDAATALGLRPAILTGWLEGEAREVGRVFGAMARDMQQVQRETGIDCYIAGGETTVTVRGSGKGGRSQELACAAAIAMRGTPDVALLAAGTDGTDGPTDAAGGLVDGKIAEAAEAAGLSLPDALRNNDSYPALKAAGGLVITGATDTNVGDLVVVVSAP